MSQQWPPPPYDPRAHRERAGFPPQYPHQQSLPPITRPGYTSQPDAQGYWPPPAAYPYAQQQPRKRRRVFMWVFLAVQVLFLIWIISAAVSTSHAAANCHQQFLTHAQCANATDAGGALGIGLIVAFWAVVDIIMGVCFMVVRMSRRNS